MSDRLDRIEAAIERLTVRHEALAQSLELTASMQRDHEGKMARMEAVLDKIVAAIQQDAENIRALARIAELHDRRLSNLEGDAQ